MAVPVRVPSMVQIELFNHLLYLKTFNCVQTNDYQIELLLHIDLLTAGYCGFCKHDIAPVS